MKSAHRLAGVISGLGAVFALALFGAPPASAATWKLDDSSGQRICLRPNQGQERTYFLIPVIGTSSVPITAEVRNLPPGSTSHGGTVFPSELEDGEHLGMVGVSLAPAPAGVYHGEVVATDGKVTDTSPVRVVYSSLKECLEL